MMRFLPAPSLPLLEIKSVSDNDNHLISVSACSLTVVENADVCK